MDRKSRFLRAANEGALFLPSDSKFSRSIVERKANRELTKSPKEIPRPSRAFNVKRTREHGSVYKTVGMIPLII